MKYKTVLELAEGIGLSENTLKELECKLAAQKVATILVAQRCKADIDQGVVAARMRVEPEFVVRLEEADNDEISSLDAINYLIATGTLKEPEVQA
jgi:hypothetical protein